MAQDSALPLLPVSPSYFGWRDQQIAAYHAGAGRPVLLIHSINAAASVFEMREPFQRLSQQFAVHAFDLLGYGNSSRPPWRYRAAIYIDLITAMLERIGEPTALIASSLGAAYAVMAAARRPQLVSRLALICPTGIGQLDRGPGIAAYTVYQLLRSPFGRLLYELLTTRASVRLFLASQAYADPANITPERLEGFYQTCRRPGAYYAPICFLSGLLNCDIAATFAALPHPTLVVWGSEAKTSPLQLASNFVRARVTTKIVTIDRASLLVQDEQPEAFVAQVGPFLAAP
ncbi:alpha/beta hydrolase [Chloroflexus sp.]|uniref:alpha/beta fold hydrolase n=1 Tax=Chloroflexus sp. TaxID=1904827 RepID=UPI00298F1BFC|nr:alpha/beta hydrolase [Chloroflexus sp.]MCX7860159.1 alpha/beta hydrolase [Chloroflexus sp.]MDW8404441.1 alpha/beta hydrolase [Chloroflexus sp.]